MTRRGVRERVRESEKREKRGSKRRTCLLEELLSDKLLI
jgi:hypothetical protein